MSERDKIVFVPTSDIDERPQRISDKPVRPKPKPIDDQTQQKWVAEGKSKKPIFSEVASSVKLIISLVVILGAAGLFFVLINAVLSFYNIHLI